MKITKEMPVYGLLLDVFLREMEKVPLYKFVDDFIDGPGGGGRLVIDDLCLSYGDGYLVVIDTDQDHTDQSQLVQGYLEFLLEEIDTDEIEGTIKRRRYDWEGQKAKEAQVKIEELNRVKRERDQAFLEKVMEKFGDAAT